jgi:hypothetical protein
MAELYGTTPARLLADDLGDWSFNLACYQLDVERRERERFEQERKRGVKNRVPPKWKG